MRFLRFIYVASVLALFLIADLNAQPAGREEVISLSKDFLKVYFKDYPRSIGHLSVYDGTEEEPRIYIVNLEPEGWILVSGNREVSPVIGFNHIGHFDFPEQNNMNPAYNWLKQSSLQIAEIYDDPTGTEHPGWVSWLGSEESKAVKSISPLIQVYWGQGDGWNQFCPADAEGPDGKTLVGCVAVAMAQALSVHMVPEQGSGTTTYFHDIYGEITNDFTESYYQWDQMDPSTPNEHSALLLYDCATAVEMDFGPTSSSATTSDAVRALSEHFSIADDIVYYIKEDYAIQDWEEMIILNLDNGLPLIYRGRHEDGGHAFNIDGLSANSSSNYFHINWGWEGSANGYFLLSDLSPGTRTYNLSQAAIFRIQPANTVGTESLADGGLITLYPNPASSLLRISAVTAERVSGIKVYSIKGVLIKTYSDPAGDIIDISDLKSGIYIIEVSLGKSGLIRRQIVKQ